MYMLSALRRFCRTWAPLALCLFLSLALCLGCAAPSVSNEAAAPAEGSDAAPSAENETSAAGETAAQAPSDGQPSDAQVTFADMKGREIQLEAPATRIVALTPADCEILFALGAGDTIIGRGEYCDYPEAVLSLPVVQSGSNTNVEQILALNPQVVALNTMGQSLEQVHALESAGVITVASQATDIAGTYEAIKMLGALTGRQAEADKLIASMEEGFAALQQEAATSGLTGKTVYFEVSPLEYGLWTGGNNTFMNEIAQLLGLTNIFADVEGWAEISEEQVLSRNPDYIVTIAGVPGNDDATLEEILHRQGWDTVTAVQSGGVFTADNNAMARPGPRLLEAAQSLLAGLAAHNGALAPAA